MIHRPFEKFSLLRPSDYVAVATTNIPDVMFLQESGFDFDSYFAQKLLHAFHLSPLIFMPKEEPSAWSENCCPGSSSDEFKQ